MDFPYHLINEAVTAALKEDLGMAGDITTNAIIAVDSVCDARIVLREDGCMAGLPLAFATFRALDADIYWNPSVEEALVEGAGA